VLIYKVLTSGEAAEFDRAGEAPLSPDDLRDGYVHLSTGAQLAGTLDRHFAKEGEVRILAVRAGQLGDALRWEASQKGEEFPHLYGRLLARDITAEWRVARGPDGCFELPSDVSS